MACAKAIDGRDALRNLWLFLDARVDLAAEQRGRKASVPSCAAAARQPIRVATSTDGALDSP